LQMSVLPFLMAAIPLAMRSAIAQGEAGRLLVRVIVWLALITAVIAAIGIIAPLIVFGLHPISLATVTGIGGLVSEASRQVDIEFAMDLSTAASGAINGEQSNGLLDFVPSNIFAALSSNQITSVLVFIIIFGIGMAVTERRTGHSLRAALTHLHDVCLLFLEWLNLFVPFGIIALIAPQIARLGSGVLLILAQFHILFAAISIAFIGASIVLTARAIRE